MQKILLFAFIAFLFSCGTKKTTLSTGSKKIPNLAYKTSFHEAIRLKITGRIPEAIKRFEALSVENPSDDAVFYALSDLYLQNKQLTQAHEAILKASKLDPANQFYAEELAYAFFDKQDYVEAAKRFQKLTEKNPQNVDFLFAYAESLLRSGKTEQSISVLNKLQDQLGLNPQLALEKFRLYRQIKKDDLAANELKNALELFPDEPNLLANLVDFYFEKKQAEEAFAYLIRLAEADPENGNAHMALAQYYDQKGNKAKMYEELGLAFRSKQVPLDQKMGILLSIYDAQIKIEPEVFVLGTIIVEEYPDDAKGYSLLGDFYIKNEDNLNANVFFHKALEFEKSKYVIWEQALYLDYELKQYEALYSDAKACLEYFTTNSQVYLFLGIGANQTKRYQEAVDALNAGQELIVNDKIMEAEFHSQRAEAYFGLGKNDKAIQAFESALKASLNNNLIKNNFAYALARNKVDLPRAERLIKEVLSETPNSGHFNDTYAWVLFQKGNYKDAETYIQLALIELPTDASILDHYGDILFKLGRIDKAVETWKQAKEAGSNNSVIDQKIQSKKYYEPIQ